MSKPSNRLASWVDDVAPMWSISGMVVLMAVRAAGELGCSTTKVVSATGLARTTAWEVLCRLEDVHLVHGTPPPGMREGWRVVTWRVDQTTLTRTLSLLNEHLGYEQ